MVGWIVWVLLATVADYPLNYDILHFRQWEHHRSWTQATLNELDGLHRASISISRSNTILRKSKSHPKTFTPSVAQVFHD